MDDDELARVMTRGLQQRGSEVEPAAVSGLVGRARSRARRRRRTRVGVVGAVAAVIVAPIAYLGLTSPAGEDHRVADRRGTDPAQVPPAPDDWRVESFHDVEVNVPADWGWGGVPSPQSGDLLYCGDGAFALPGKTGDAGGAAVPYVGRADFGMTDLCIQGSDTSPVSPFVWLGSPLEVGAADIGGVPTRTVQAGSVRVTVGDADDVESQQILSTVTALGDADANGCATIRAYEEDSPLGDVSGVTSVGICVYLQQDPGAEFLAFSSRTRGDAAGQIFGAIRETPMATDPVCAEIPESPPGRVVMHFETAKGPVTVTAVMGGGCPGYGSRPLTPDNVRPWASGALGLYISAGDLPADVARFFHPIPG